MNAITIAGAGAFGTALAVALARRHDGVRLWARDPAAARAMQSTRTNQPYLGSAPFPDGLLVSSRRDIMTTADLLLLAVPTQNLRGFLETFQPTLQGKTCVLCCKGIEQETGQLPSQIVNDVLPGSPVAVLTGPGFAAEIAQALPTALTLAADHDTGAALQERLSTDTLRLYLSTDPTGAQLGGALKNVVAIACGIAVGAGLGESARAALMTRGYAEMSRLAISMGAQQETLAGLSGLGDLALTCTSLLSRNYSLGHTLGQGGQKAVGKTFEGVATARATVSLARKFGVEMPIVAIVSAVLEGELTIAQATIALLSRPLKSEM